MSILCRYEMLSDLHLIYIDSMEDFFAKIRTNPLPVDCISYCNAISVVCQKSCAFASRVAEIAQLVHLVGCSIQHLHSASHTVCTIRLFY